MRRLLGTHPICSLLAFCLTLWLLTPPAISAQSGADRLFDEGAVLYQQGDFRSALEKFRQIEASGLSSTALLYNLGNCHYKLDQIGKAILYYERALRQQPGDEDIEANLQIANQATVDKIQPPEEFALARWLIAALHLIPFPLVLRFGGALYLLMMAALLARLLSRSLRTRSRLGLGAALLGTLLVLTVALAGLQWWDMRNRIEGVVQAPEVTARSSPEPGATEVFTIHEGTKVRIDDQTGEWIEVVLPDGKAGWVPGETVERI